jgi:predicted acyl esterase
MDGNDNIIKEQVVPLWAGKNWCGGDRLVSWTDIEPSKTTTYLHIGLERGSQRLSFNSPGISIPVTMN